MPSEELYRGIQNLERKIQLVLSENKKLKDDLTRVKDESDSLRAKAESQAISVSNFQNQMKISKLVNNMMVREGDSAQLKREIDDYIKEIDKCIAHLAE